MDEPLGSRAQSQRTIRLAPQGGPPDVATTRLRPRATPPRASRGNRPGLGHCAGARLRGDSRPVVGRAVAAVPGAASQNNPRAMHDWSAKPPPNREERLLPLVELAAGVRRELFFAPDDSTNQSVLCAVAVSTRTGPTDIQAVTVWPDQTDRASAVGDSPPLPRLKSAHRLKLAKWNGVSGRLNWVARSAADADARWFTRTRGCCPRRRRHLWARRRRATRAAPLRWLPLPGPRRARPPGC